ncbi:hypothetical protein [Gordonia rhizosphera]|uniref:Uncharacterized protein n=1 Tax=Gordonia rhizosphera NBRC 16068 TaxID=1108045 RepID=K6W809_9ACTN|nr:hypothetical protein [Gordonia rhizosphera]GAB89861.1 hypothetical protein GORHZ_073_00040 [Gordonia rhizosphera NBRC 16068]
MTAPKWNLDEDWPDHLKPRDSKTGLPAVLFSPPIEKLTVPDHNYSLSLDTSANGIKKLVIDIQTGQQVNALAVMPGVVSTSGTSLTLQTDLLSTLGASNALSGTLKKSVQRPVDWFNSWATSGTIPRTIVFGNITASKTSTTADAGDVLGSLGNHPTDPSKRRLTISMEYAGSTAKQPKAMHPREFFSLLFWRAEHDPILQANPTPYDHPLFRSMMSTAEDGKRGPASSFINQPTDAWLGLRPPLRIYERVKWEHIKEHLRNDYGSGNWTGSDGSVQKRILNPYVYDGGAQGYKSSAKCNVYAGEMLFRAGLRTLAYGQGISGCSSGHLPRFIKYCSPKVVTKHFQTKLQVKGKIHHDSLSQDKCSGSSTPTHEIYTVFGSKEVCTAKAINDHINQGGGVYVIASLSHVAVIDQVVSCSQVLGGVATRKMKTIQQWHVGFSRSSYSDSWNTAKVSESVIVRIWPGGDPTEKWGQLDLNCLKGATP